MVRMLLPVPLLLAFPAMAQVCQPSWLGEFRPQVADSGPAHNAFVFDDDGAGPNPPALFVASVGSIGGASTPQGLAKWNGRSWERIPLNPSVSGSPVVFDPDGPGPQPARVYLTGVMRNGRHGIASWDGSTLTHVVDVGELNPSESWWQTVKSLFVLDADGPGPELPGLYAGVEVALSFPGVARFEGLLFRLDPGGWVRIEGIDGVPESAAVYDPDGSGPAAPAVYIAHTAEGTDPFAGDWTRTAVSRIVGTGSEHVLYSEEPYFRYATIATFDPDGPGLIRPGLYIGGIFRLAPSGPPDFRLAYFDGHAINPVATLDGRPTLLTPFQADPLEGGEPSLYISGRFSHVGGVAAMNIARLGAGGLSPLGPGIPGSIWSGPVTGLLMHDDGVAPGGPRLFTTGSFAAAGSLPSRGIAAWDGQYWLPPGNAVSDPVHAMVAADLGDGPSLYVGGGMARVGGLPVSGVARWNGSAWAGVGTGFNGPVDALALHNEGGTPRLVAAGRFTAAGGPVNHVAILRNGQWQPLGAGINGNVSCLLAAGGALYAGGSFTDVPGAPGAQRLAKWDGTAWRSLGGFDDDVAALAHFQGSLYAAGRFNHITNPDGSVGLYARIARFDGARWVSPLYGINYYATSMAVHNDGSGEALYVGGAFDTASGAPASRVARWNGAAWSAVGAGLSGPSSPTVVTALASIDEGGIKALYAGGNFTQSGATAARGVARWNGSQWSPLGAGVDGPPRTLAALGPGGPQPRRLYIGGEFLSAGGAPSWSLASLSLCGCYANCDGSTTPPVLSINDFVCFQGLYAAGDPRANCDGSTVPPVLNISDFICFQQKFAAGCP